VAADSVAQDIHLRLKAREAPQPRFCWHCRKPLHARSDRCPFCGEGQ
jgi:predicted amidophosphoribosyltransferase